MYERLILLVRDTRYEEEWYVLHSTVPASRKFLKEFSSPIESFNPRLFLYANLDASSSGVSNQGLRRFVFLCEDGLFMRCVKRTWSVVTILLRKKPCITTIPQQENADTVLPDCNPVRGIGRGWFAMIKKRE